MDPALAKRVEACWSELSREQYAALAGLKTQPALSAIYRRWADLFSAERLAELAAVERASDADAARHARHLREYLVHTRAEFEAGELLDQRLAWEATATVLANGDAIPLRQLPRVLANTEDAATRWRFDDARLARLREIERLDQERFEHEWDAFGLESGAGYIAAWESLSGIRTAPLVAQAGEVLADTEPVYRELVSDALRRELGLGWDRARAVDRLRLERAPHLDRHVGDVDLQAVARRQLGELGLDLDAGGRIRVDFEPRPAKWSRPFCSVLRVPDEVVLVLAPSGTWRDWYAFFHELGHALHFASVDPQLPFADRALGDISVTETYARLFEVAANEPLWLQRYLGLSRAEARAFAHTARLIDLIRLRRQAAKLIYELELHGQAGFGGMPDRYGAILTEATGFRHAPEAYLDDVDAHLYCARYLRSWALEAILAAALRERFDEDWFRNPRCGPFLLELFARGQREDGEQLSRLLAGSDVSFEPWLRRVRGEG